LRAMSETLKVTLTGRISGVKLTEGIVEGEQTSAMGDAPVSEVQDSVREEPTAAGPGATQEQIQAQTAEMERLRQLCAALEGAVQRLDQLQADVLEQTEQQLVDLAMGIARKVLAQEIDTGHYDIESIIKEALKRVSTRREVLIHLNPEDHARCEVARQTGETESTGRVKFVPDPQVEPAQCLIETPEGTIESSMATRLANVVAVLDLPERDDGDS